MVQRSVGFAEKLEVASVVVAVAVAYAEVYVNAILEESECEVLLAWCEVCGFGHLSTRTHGEVIEIFRAVKVVVGDHKAHPLTIGTRITFGHGRGSTGALPTGTAR